MLLKKLENLSIAENFEQYNQMIKELTKDSIKDAISFLTKNNNNEELFKLLISSLINKIITFTGENTSDLTEYIPYILNSTKSLENPISIFFQLLENLPQKRDEVSRLKILEILAKYEFNVNNIVNLLYKNDTDSIVCDILKIKENMVDDFIRNSVKIENNIVAKNLGSVLPSLPHRFFVNYNSFLFLFESENHYLRNCLLDIFQILIKNFKDNENIEAIRELTIYISERLNDANFYVRSKALGVIGELFKTECILKDQRNILIREIIERIKDKTVIVRKRSISLLTQILINHPFKDRDHFDRSNDQNLENIKMTEIQKRVAIDFNEFVDLMEISLSSITSLLEYNLKTDLVEILEFIKNSYLLKLKGAKESIQKILGIVFTKDKQIVIDTFKEILTHRGEILFEFINDKAFEVILSYLEIDEKILYKNIFNERRIFESVYILRHTLKSISEQNALSLIQHITEILFKSQNEGELKTNIETYINTLCIIVRLNHRIDNNSDIFILCIKNIIKMMFFERSVIKYTVELIYSTSNNPEITIGKFLKSLCLTKSTLKMVDAVGWIGLNQYYLLERMERSLKGSNITTTMRKSLESMDGVREKRKSLEESRRASLSNMPLEKGTRTNKLSLKFEELEETLKTKSDEEIADFFFYLKEKEIIYSKDSILHQFIPVLIDSLKSDNFDIQSVAYSSLFRLMLISSDFFNEYKHLIFEGLYSTNIAVKNNTIAAFHDFLIFYNTSLDSSVLFEKLKDEEVRKNALLVLFNLLHKNIIRLKKNVVSLISLLFDEELGQIVKTLIKSFTGNNNATSIIFYETYISDLGPEYIKYLAPLVGQSIQESLFLKCLNNFSSSNSGDIEKLKVVYENFELSEKFIKENLFREEMKLLINQKIPVESKEVIE